MVSTSLSPNKMERRYTYKYVENAAIFYSFSISKLLQNHTIFPKIYAKFVEHTTFTKNNPTFHKSNLYYENIKLFVIFKY